MAARDFSWYLAKPLRFVSSELGNVSEVASLSALGKSPTRPRCAMIQPSLAALFHESTWAHGADVELSLERTGASRLPFSSVS
jgi:hypothetical protein